MQINSANVVQTQRDANQLQAQQRPANVFDSGTTSSIRWFWNDADNMDQFYEDLNPKIHLGPGGTATSDTWASILVIQDISAPIIRYYYLAHHDRKLGEGLVANLQDRMESSQIQAAKAEKLLRSAIDGLTGNFPNPTVIGPRSLIVNLGNSFAKPEAGTLWGDLIRGLTAETIFMCPVTVHCEEFKDFCARFHGQMSQQWKENNLITFASPGAVLDNNGHPIEFFSLLQNHAAKQFVHDHYDLLEQMMASVEDPQAMIKPLHRWLCRMRTILPVNQQAEVGFGWAFGQREFAWMFPHLRCILMDELAIYKARLAEAMIEAISFE